jgi:anti-sigma factor RsiW
LTDREGLTCRELVELVTDYLEGALDPAERARFEEHLASCDGCTNFLRQMRITIQLTGSLTEEQIAEPQRSSLLLAFRTWKQTV